MNINSVSPHTPQSITATGRDVTNAASFLSNLEQTQQADPALFQKVTTAIATRLQDVAQNAASKGNTAFSDTLNQLATQFRNGQIPTAQTLQQDGILGHGNRHTRHAWMEVNRAMKDAINDANPTASL